MSDTSDILDMTPVDNTVPSGTVTDVPEEVIPIGPAKSTASKVPVYVIHDKSVGERAEHFTNYMVGALHKNGLDNLTAVTTPNVAVAEYLSKSCTLIHRERECFAKHVNALAHLTGTDEALGLVMEDDVFFLDDDFATKMNTTIKDGVTLFGVPASTDKAEVGSLLDVHATMSAIDTSCYIIYRAVAEKLLAHRTEQLRQGLNVTQNWSEWLLATTKELSIVIGFRNGRLVNNGSRCGAYLSLTAFDGSVPYHDLFAKFATLVHEEKADEAKEFYEAEVKDSPIGQHPHVVIQLAFLAKLNKDEDAAKTYNYAWLDYYRRQQITIPAKTKLSELITSWYAA